MLYTKTKITVCPVCGLPAKYCKLAFRLSNLKFAETEKKSAKLRTQHVLRFHADICPTCKLPVEVCKQKKISKFDRIRLNEAKNGLMRGKRVDGVSTVISPDEIARALKEPCKCPFHLKAEQEAVWPEWWTP